MESAASPVGGLAVTPEEASCRMVRSQFLQGPAQYQLSRMDQTEQHHRQKCLSKACSCARLNPKYSYRTSSASELFMQEQSTHTSQLLGSLRPNCGSVQTQKQRESLICMVLQRLWKLEQFPRYCPATPCPMACSLIVLFISTNSPPKPWMAKLGSAMFSSCDQNPSGARLSTRTFCCRSLEPSRPVKYSQQLQSMTDRSSEYRMSVKLLRSCSRKFDTSMKRGFCPRYRNPLAFCKVQKVKFLRVSVPVEPGFCPQVATVSGARTTPSRITPSMTDCRPTSVKSSSAVKSSTATVPQILWHFRIAKQIISQAVSQKQQSKVLLVANQVLKASQYQRQQYQEQQPKLFLSLEEKSERQSSLASSDCRSGRLCSSFSSFSSRSLICTITGSIRDCFLEKEGSRVAFSAPFGDFSRFFFSFCEGDCLRLRYSGMQLVMRHSFSLISCSSSSLSSSSAWLSLSSSTLAVLSSLFSLSMLLMRLNCRSISLSLNCTRSISSWLWFSMVSRSWASALILKQFSEMISRYRFSFYLQESEGLWVSSQISLALRVSSRQSIFSRFCLCFFCSYSISCSFLPSQSRYSASLSLVCCSILSILCLRAAFTCLKSSSTVTRMSLYLTFSSDSCQNLEKMSSQSIGCTKPCFLRIFSSSTAILLSFSSISAALLPFTLSISNSTNLYLSACSSKFRYSSAICMFLPLMTVFEFSKALRACLQLNYSASRQNFSFLNFSSRLELASLSLSASITFWISSRYIFLYFYLVDLEFDYSWLTVLARFDYSLLYYSERRVSLDFSFYISKVAAQYLMRHVFASFFSACSSSSTALDCPCCCSLIISIACLASSSSRLTLFKLAITSLPDAIVPCRLSIVLLQFYNYRSSSQIFQQYCLALTSISPRIQTLRCSLRLRRWISERYWALLLFRSFWVIRRWVMSASSLFSLEISLLFYYRERQYSSRRLLCVRLVMSSEAQLCLS